MQLQRVVEVRARRLRRKVQRELVHRDKQQILLGRVTVDEITFDFVVRELHREV